MYLQEAGEADFSVENIFLPHAFSFGGGAGLYCGAAGLGADFFSEDFDAVELAEIIVKK